MVRRLDFRDHRRELDLNRYVYAVASRRARGVSIGVNLNPDKVCNFDCPYCQVDRSNPGGPADVDVDSLAGELEALLAEVGSGALWRRAPFDTAVPELRHLADVAFSGDGEPTTPREFPAAARRVRAALDASAFAATPLRLITNATRFDRPGVREALACFDELWCKLDAGTAAYFARVDGTRFPFERLLSNLRDVARERPIVVQSLFLSDDGRHPDDAEITAYAQRLRGILDAGGAIDRVQVYTVARRPADPRVAPLPGSRLEEIAARVRELGLSVEVFGADG